MANPKSATICLQQGCGMKTTNDHGYCPRHARVCKNPGCENRISYNSNRCRPCSIIDSQEGRTEAIRKSLSNRPKNPLTRKEEILDIIARAEEAKSQKRFPNVCDGIISENKKLLEEMERVENVRAKINI